MKINEIFYSIQGEGKLIGFPTIFIRATGCNLRCTYCDTTYAYADGIQMSPNKILESLKKWVCKRICITGGEPLLQNDTLQLLRHLYDTDYQVSIETNGSQDLTPLLPFKSLVISMDIKCPTSTMQTFMALENITLLRPHDQLKFVISAKEDYEYAKTIIRKYKPCCPCIIQSCTGNTRQLAEWILKDEAEIRLSVQLHKLLWKNKRGV